MSQFNQLKSVTRTASAPRPTVNHNYESVDGSQIARAPVVTKLKSPVSPNPVTRTASGPTTVKHNYESVDVPDDTKVKQSAQIALPPVATRPKSPNKEQNSTPIYGNVDMTKQNAIRCSPQPPPIPPKRVSSTPPTERKIILATTKSEQQVSPVTEWRNTLPFAKNQQPSPAAVTVRSTSNNNTSHVAALTKEIETKLVLQSPPSSVANRPKLQMSMSPVTAQRKLYNNTPSTVTERAPSPVVVVQQASPAKRNSPLHDEEMYTVPSVTEGYVNTGDVLSYRQAVLTSKQEFVPKQLTPPTEFNGGDLHNSERPVHPHDPEHYEYVTMHKKPESQITESDEDHKANKAYLQSLSRKDILQLLDNMNFIQHKKIFQEEQVDGVTLVALTSDDLKELGVTKGVHLVRLLHLIKGKVSAKAILENTEN